MVFSAIDEIGVVVVNDPRASKQVFNETCLLEYSKLAYFKIVNKVKVVVCLFQY